MTWVLVVFSATLLTSLVLAILWGKKSQQKLQAQLEHASSELEAAERRHQTEASETKAIHARVVDDQRTLYANLRKRVMLPPGEQTSREHILAVCEEEELDAIVLSNVLFRPVESNDESIFHAQIDHVVVTQNALLIVESKYWNAIVFDGIDFKSASPEMRLLWSDLGDKLEPNQTARISRNGNHVEFDISSPAKQARRQAKRLSQYLDARNIPSPWISTCVYYCHSGGIVKHAAKNGKTALVSTRAGLRQSVAISQTMRKDRVNIDAILDTLVPLSTDVTGTGRFRHNWPNRVDAPARSSDRNSAVHGKRTATQGLDAAGAIGVKGSHLSSVHPSHHLDKTNRTRPSS